MHNLLSSRQANAATIDIYGANLDPDASSGRNAPGRPLTRHVGTACYEQQNFQGTASDSLGPSTHRPLAML